MQGLVLKNPRPEDVALICPRGGLTESEINSNHHSLAQTPGPDLAL